MARNALAALIHGEIKCTEHCPVGAKTRADIQMRMQAVNFGRTMVAYTQVTRLERAQVNQRIAHEVWKSLFVFPL